MPRRTLHAEGCNAHGGDPLRDRQIISGTNEQEVSNLFLQILTWHGVSGLEMGRVGAQLSAVVAAYLARVENELLMAPAIVSEPNVQEWLTRLEHLAATKRWSELEGYQRWLNLSFGRDKDSRHLPIDVRLHRRLGELYLEQSNFDGAIEQLTLARHSAPRDIYVLRRLGEARIKRAVDSGSEDREEIEGVMARISGLDREAVTANPETAALYGKYKRQVLRRPQEAIPIFRAALKHTPDSYYLADLLAQTQLEVGNTSEARKTYGTALRILEQLRDQNIWTLATRAAAYLAIGDLPAAQETLDDLSGHRPTPNQARSIQDGLRLVTTKLPIPENEIEPLLQRLAP